jgi:hypothetical protein
MQLSVLFAISREIPAKVFFSKLIVIFKLMPGVTRIGQVAR